MPWLNESKLVNEAGKITIYFEQYTIERKIVEDVHFVK